MKKIGIFTFSILFIICSDTFSASAGIKNARILANSLWHIRELKQAEGLRDIVCLRTGDFFVLEDVERELAKYGFEKHCVPLDLSRDFSKPPEGLPIDAKVYLVFEKMRVGDGPYLIYRFYK